MMPVTRRRMLTILAGAGSCAAIGPAAASALPPRFLEWRGTALGADARLVFYDAERARARRALTASLAEIERLEAIFSLYREDSELSRLNATGQLANPSPEMRHLIGLGREIGRLSEGAFDITVQPLWRAIADYFAADPDGPGPTPDALGNTVRLVDYRRIETGPDGIKLRPGMAITLNGIAQGFITEQVTDLLRRQGWRHILNDLGETRALEGRAWPVHLERRPGRVMLRSQAIATSSGAGTTCKPGGGWHHLIDPASGRSARHYRSVSVIAPRAALADALSTALFVAEPALAERVVRRFPMARAIIERHGGGFIEAGTG